MMRARRHLRHVESLKVRSGSSCEPTAASSCKDMTK